VQTVFRGAPNTESLFGVSRDFVVQPKVKRAARISKLLTFADGSADYPARRGFMLSVAVDRWIARSIRVSAVPMPSIRGD